jgi:hypothetical protein
MKYLIQSVGAHEARKGTRANENNEMFKEMVRIALADKTKAASINVNNKKEAANLRNQLVRYCEGLGVDVIRADSTIYVRSQDYRA